MQDSPDSAVLPDAPRLTDICISSEHRLLNDDILTRLRHDDSISSLVEDMRKNEALVTERAKNLGDVRVHLACRREIAFPLEEEGIEPPRATLSPAEFLQAIYQLPRTPRTASLRRLVREVARTYARACVNDLSIPTEPDGFPAMWDRTMEGEPLWSEDQPASAFRTKAARILSGRSLSTVLQQCADPADYEMELSLLLSFLKDKTVALEVRATCGYALFEWIHPFLDGNGHVGRTLLLTLLQDIYSLASMVWFSQALVWERGRTSGLFAPLRNGNGTLVGFCRAMLEQLHEAQGLALDMLMEA